MLDRGRVPGVAQPHVERALERVERLLVLAGVEELPAEVVQQRAEPVRRGLRGLGELDAAVRPGDEPRAVRRRERAHVRRVAGKPVLPGLACCRERGLEERYSRVLVPARAAQSAALEVDADADARNVLHDLVEEPVAFLEAVAQAFHARQLRQRLGAKRTEALLGRVEVVEVPEWAERIGHLPVVEKC